ncbi:MAG: NUDIX hydrolase [Halobacteriales archaeon SW_9_67_24]|nr:MAG: NUDIX hydrolase [Halobacteriales archaeon SW_9_67_24]
MTDDSVDVLPLLDELRVIGQSGLMDADSPYDRERNERLLELASEYYGRTIELPPEEIRERLAADLGYATAKVSAGAAIFDDDGRILLVKRTSDGTWGFPAGGVDPNESASEAAIRETREETGIEARIDELIDVYHGEPGKSGPHSVVHVQYLCERTGGTHQPSHETDAVRYWNIDAVPVWHPDARERAIDAHGVWLETRGSE